MWLLKEEIPQNETVLDSTEKIDEKIEVETTIKEFIPIIRYLASRFNYRLPAHLDVDDLVNAGIVGLMDAIEKYDKDKNTKFRTYAEYRIRGAMLDEVRAMDWLPRSVRDKISLLEKAYIKLEKKLGRHATEEEVAEALGVSIDKLQSLIFQAKGTTLINFDDIGSDSEGGEIIDRIVDKKSKDPLGLIISDDIKKSLGDAITSLPDKEKIIVSLYYYDGLTMKEIGKVLDITESRVSQLHTQAVLKLKGRLNEVVRGKKGEEQKVPSLPKIKQRSKN